MDKELVTLVVAIYNVEKYVVDCVNSIINQSYQKLQIILVDDGSTDASAEICDKFQTEDERIQVIHQKNQGLSMARNVGIDHAKGRWIAFIDGDDVIHPMYVENLYTAVKRTNSQMAICYYKKVNADKSIIFEESKENYIIVGAQKLLEQWHGKYTEIETVAWNKLYNIELFKKGIKYPQGKLHEDVYVSHLLVEQAKQIVILEQKLYMYLQRSDSIIGKTLSEERIYQSLEAQLERLKFFSNYTYKKARYNLKKGLFKHLLYYYIRVVFKYNISIKNEKKIKQYLKNIAFQFIQDTI